jgi:hypothetical protein
MRILLAFLLAGAGFAQQATDSGQASQAPSQPAVQQTQTPAQTQPPAQTPAQPATQTQPPAQTAQPATAAAPAAAAESPAPTSEPWITGSLYLGYRTLTDIKGSLAEYRTLVDLSDGPKLLDINFSIIDPKKRWFDRLDAWGSGWGDRQYNTAHVNARKLGVYDFTFDYRNIALFEAEPSFANPFAPGGFDEQSFDTRRRIMSADLSLFSGKHITPYLAFDRNSGTGTGIEPWAQDANNTYPVPLVLSDSTNDYRGGVRFEYRRFHVTLEEGGTTYKNDDRAYDSTYQPGDQTQPVLGQTLYLTSLQQAYGIRGTSTYSKILLTANPTSWIDIYGQFLYSDINNDIHFSEIAGGNFLNLATLLFYTGQYTLGTGAANQPHTTGNMGFEVRPLKKLRIIQSWMTDRYHDAASPMVAEQLLITPTLAGPTLLTDLNFSQYVNYNQEQVDLIYDLSKSITLRGGYRYVWGDAQVLGGDLSERGLLVPGQLQRNIGLAGFTYRRYEKLTVNLNFEGASSDHIYFRTSLNNYEKGRALARYQATKTLAVQASYQILNNENPAPDIRYDFQSRDTAVTLYWTPNSSKWVSAMGEYDRSTLRSDILYLIPQFLTPAVSNYRDNAHTAVAAVDLTLPRTRGGKLTVGGSMFIEAGFQGAESRPTRYYEPLVRLSLPIVKHVFLNADWQYYGYGEPFYIYEGLHTNVFTTGIRLVK